MTRNINSYLHGLHGAPMEETVQGSCGCCLPIPMESRNVKRKKLPSYSTATPSDKLMVTLKNITTALGHVRPARKPLLV